MLTAHERTAVRPHLNYDSLEKLEVSRPVDRLAFIAELCRGKRVLDIGCFDETALIKRDTDQWLHGRISREAQQVVGIDNSDKIPAEGLSTGANAVIYKGDGVNPFSSDLDTSAIDIAVAGEFIEHIESPLQFFRNIKAGLPGKELVISTPNGASFANSFMGIFKREVQHPDHIQIFTFKILNTLCMRAGFEDWEIIPYRFYATEMILNSRGPKRAAARVAEAFIRAVERIFPLLCFGYVVRIRI